jgi:hypothetical protein
MSAVGSVRYQKLVLADLHIIKSSLFWDIKPCSPYKVNGRFSEHVSYNFGGRTMA